MKASNPNERKAIGYGLAAVVLWSTVATGFKLGLAHLALAQLLLLGTTLSWLVFLLYCGFKRQWTLAKGDRVLVLVLGLINPLAYYFMLFAAYERLPAHIAQPLNYTWAITLALLAVPILKQHLDRATLMGIGVSYAGVVLLLLTSAAPEQEKWDVLGITLALLSTVLWAGYWLLNTRCASPSAPVMFWSFSAALPVIFVICWLGPGFPTLTPLTLGYGAWVGCIEMGFTFLLWQHALQLTRHAARIGQLIFLSPFISLLLIQNVLDEKISMWTVAALGVILVGIHIARPSSQTA